MHPLCAGSSSGGRSGALDFAPPVYNVTRQDVRDGFNPMAAQNDLPEIKLDATSLYREEVFTDRRAGTLRKLTPITVDGSVDSSRQVLFSGQTQLLTPAGVLPLVFEIE